MFGGEFRVFSIGDIPVSISPWFVLLLIWWLGDGWQAGLIWAACVTVSILVHELGHALVARYFRLQPQILLHGLGGLCRHDRAESDRDDALIIAAGPSAGLLLGVTVWLVSWLALDLVPMEHRMVAERVVSALLYVNIGWSFLNLLPLWPLDGGQLFRLGLLRVARPKPAHQITHVTSLVLLVLGAGFGLLVGMPFVALLAAFGVWLNVRAMRGEISSGAIRSVSRYAAEQVAKARAAYDAGNYEEAARLCHVLRQENNPSTKAMRECWQILGPSTARLGRHEEALNYLSRARETPDVVEAKIECFYALGMDAELDEILGSKAFARFPDARRREILEVVRA